MLAYSAHASTRRSLATAGQDKLRAVDTLAADAVDTRLAALNDLVTAHSRRDVAAMGVWGGARHVGPCR